MATVEQQQPFIDDITQAFVDGLASDERLALIIMYGSRSPKKATAAPSSDVEFIAIYDDQPEDNLIRFDIEFVYKSIPADLWSTSWKWLEQLATREDPSVVAATSYILGHVVYARSDADLSRFEDLVTEMQDGEKYRDTYLDRARERYSNIQNLLGGILIAAKHHDLELAREHIWHLNIGTTILLAELNQHHYLDNWGRNMREVFQLDLLPDGWEEGMRTLVTTADFDEMIDLATGLVDRLRLLLIDVQQGRSEEVTYDYIDEDEADMLAYLGKIKKAAAEQDIFGAGYAVHDFIRLFKLDLIKQAGLWDKSTALKLPTEWEDEAIYTKQGWPEFHQALTTQDFEKLVAMADEMETRIRGDVLRIQQFDDRDAMRDYIAATYADLW